MRRLTATVLFVLRASPADLHAQGPGWSTPVPIDTAREIPYPLIAVSPKGQIAVLSILQRTALQLHVSDDNGKTFHLQSTLHPPPSFYDIWYPNGLAYDSNSNLWVYWAWDECHDEDCIFASNRWSYLSRSTDGGRTFDHVGQFERGINLGVSFTHEQVMRIGSDNTIHFLRDTVWFIGAYPQMNLI